MPGLSFFKVAARAGGRGGKHQRGGHVIPGLGAPGIRIVVSYGPAEGLLVVAPFFTRRTFPASSFFTIATDRLAASRGRPTTAGFTKPGTGPISGLAAGATCGRRRNRQDRSRQARHAVRVGKEGRHLGASDQARRMPKDRDTGKAQVCVRA